MTFKKTKEVYREFRDKSCENLIKVTYQRILLRISKFFRLGSNSFKRKRLEVLKTSINILVKNKKVAVTYWEK